MSWNPITGCLHNCVYCVTGDTLVLTSDFEWKPIRDIQVGDEIVGFSEYPLSGRNRYLVNAKVLAKVRRRKRKKVYLIKGEHGQVKATADHLWLVKRGGGGRTGRHVVWRRTYQIHKYGHPIKFLAIPVLNHLETEDYVRGYISGLFTGDGTSGYYESKRDYFARLAMKDIEAVERFLKYSDMLKIPFDNRVRNHKTNMTILYKVESWRYDVYHALHDVVENKLYNNEYARGFLAGLFDAEGSISVNGTLRISTVSYTHLTLPTN